MVWCVKRKRVLVAHNIRSAHNVGSFFRTADAAGVAKIYLTGYTPAPVDRFKRPRKDVAKTALGAEKTVPWESVVDITELIENLKRAGVRVVALEQDLRAQHYRRYQTHEKAALIVGNEVEGVPEGVRALCDDIIEIPMNGSKESLNVAVAAGVALFALRDNQ